MNSAVHDVGRLFRGLTCGVKDLARCTSEGVPLQTKMPSTLRVNITYDASRIHRAWSHAPHGCPRISYSKHGVGS